MPSRYDLVLFNLAIARYPLDHPGMAGFVGQIEAVNRLAAESPGFLWTPAEGEQGDSTAVFANPRLLPNISTWRSLEHAYRFVYEGAHGAAVRRRDEWFERAEGAAYVLWWTPAGSRPSWADAAERLRHLDTHGPSPRAFTFSHPFDPTVTLKAE